MPRSEDSAVMLANHDESDEIICPNLSMTLVKFMPLFDLCGRVDQNDKSKDNHAAF
jgi:hypothetical protein